MPRARLRIPTSLTSAVVSAAFAASCSQSPMPADANGDAPEIAADVGDALADTTDIGIDVADTTLDTRDASIDAPDADVMVADADLDADADIDCFTVCATEIFPGPDGSLQMVVFYADGAMSYDAICDVPPLPPQCGV